MPRVLTITALVLLCASTLLAQRNKKDQEPVTQTLELPPEPPAVLTAHTTQLAFDITPLSSKGLLSQQVRDHVKALLSRHRRSRFVKLRAFVAGSGDLRRVQSVVAEMFAEKRQSLPVMSVVQVGALPLTGSYVQIEATLETSKTANPHGIAFISGQLVEAGDAPARPADLVRESLARVRRAVTAAGSSEKSTLRVTCFASGLDDIQTIYQSAAAAFPRVPFAIAQTQRAFTKPLAECEAIAALDKPAASPVVFLSPEGFPKSPAYSHIAAVSAPTLVFAGAQLAFFFTEDDARLAFQRLDKTLQSANSSLKSTVMMNTYSLSQLITGHVRTVRFEFLDKARPPASTLLHFEDLPSMDAAFALEAVALPLPASSQSK